MAIQAAAVAPFSAAALLHPSRLTEADAANVVGPLLLLPANNDADMAPLIRFSEQVHGWSIRGLWSYLGPCGAILPLPASLPACLSACPACQPAVLYVGAFCLLPPAGLLPCQLTPQAMSACQPLPATWLWLPIFVAPSSPPHSRPRLSHHPSYTPGRCNTIDWLHEHESAMKRMLCDGHRNTVLSMQK